MTADERLKEEGLEQGELKKAKQMAKNLIAMGDYSMAKIAMVTGLTEKEIDEIKKDIDK